MKKLFGICVLLALAILLRTEAAYAATHATTTIGNAEAFDMMKGNIFKFSVAGKITPIAGSTDKNTIPDLHPYAIWMQNGTPWATPLTIQQHTIDYTDKNSSSAKYCGRLVIKTPWGDKADEFALTVDTTEVSQDIPDSLPYMQSAESLTAPYGLYKKIPTADGSYDYNKPSVFVATILGDDCGRSDPGITWKPITVDVVDNAYFPGGPCTANCSTAQVQYNGPSLFTTFFKWVKGVWTEITKPITEAVPWHFQLTGKFRDGWLTALHCFAGRCAPGSSDEPMANAVAEAQGAFSASLIPRDTLNKPIDFNALILQTVQLSSALPNGKSDIDLNRPWLNTNSATEDLKTSACAVIPKSLQGTRDLGDAAGHLDPECNPTPTPTPEDSGSGWNCKTNLPELASAQTNTQGKQWADNLVKPPCDSTNNAWEMCHNDVIDRASKPNSCYDPIFALTIWLHETGASNYECTAQVDNVPENLVEDFGQHTAGEPHNFDSQITSFLSLSYANYSCPHTLNDWWSIFWFGACYDTMSDVPASPGEPSQKEQIAAVVGYTQQVYTMLSGKPAPDWPVICN